MAGAFESVLATADLGSGTTTGVVTVSGATAGRLLIAALSLRGSASTNIVDDTGNWTLRQEIATGGVGDSKGAILDRVATGTTSDDVDASWETSSEWVLTVCEYSGLDATSPYDSSVEKTDEASVGDIAANGTHTISGSPTAQPGMAISCMHNPDERSASEVELSIASGGFTIDEYHVRAAGANPFVAVASRTYTGTGSQSCEWDTSRTVSWEAYSTLGFYLEPASGTTTTNAPLETIALTPQVPTSLRSLIANIPLNV